MSTSHQEESKKICKICRGNIKIGKSYVNVKTVDNFTAEIKTLFNYGINLDDKEIHPVGLCRYCLRQLRRLHVHYKNIEPVQIATFDPHTENCYLCRVHRLPQIHNFSVKKQKSTMSTVYIKKEAKKHGFQETWIETRNDVLVLLKKNSVFNVSLKTEVDLETWWDQIFVYGRLKNHESLPQVLSTLDSVQLFFSKLSKLFICNGNDDFKKVARRRIGEPIFLLGNDQKLKGTIENDTQQDLKKTEYLTITSLDRENNVGVVKYRGRL